MKPEGGQFRMDITLESAAEALIDADKIVVDLRLECQIVDSLGRNVTADLHTGLDRDGSQKDEQAQEDHNVQDKSLKRAITTVSTDEHLVGFSDPSVHDVFLRRRKKSHSLLTAGFEWRRSHISPDWFFEFLHTCDKEREDHKVGEHSNEPKSSDHNCLNHGLPILWQSNRQHRIVQNRQFDHFSCVTQSPQLILY